MCQARPGTRCSADARKTLSRAEDDYNRAESETWRVRREDLSEEQQAHARDALVRAYQTLERAKRQWYETPNGIQELRDEGDDNAATIYAQAREYRRQSAQVISDANDGITAPLPTKGFASVKVECEEGTNNFDVTLEKVDASSADFEEVSSRGSYSHNTTMDGYIYRTPEIDSVVVKNHHPKSPTALSRVKLAMIHKQANDHTFVDREGAYLQSTSRVQEAMEASVNANSDHYEADFESRLDYAELSALRSAANGDPDNEELQSELVNAQENYTKSSARTKRAYYDSRRAEGVEEISREMNRIIRTSSSKEDVIKGLSEVEPNPPVEMKDVHFYVDGFERQRRNLLKEAVNYNW